MFFLRFSIGLSVSFLCGYCYSQPTQRDLRISGFFDLYRKIKTSKYDSVFIYDVNVSKRGKSIDSVLMAIEPLKLNSFPDRYTYLYDSLNREIKRFEIRNGLSILNAEKKYNNLGQLAERILYNTDGKTHSKIFYTYDSVGKLMESEHLTGYWYRKPYIQRRNQYSYSTNYLIEETEYWKTDLDSSWSVTWTRKYDTLRNIIYYKEESDKTYWDVISEYNDLNQLTKEIIDGSERKKSIQEYRYSTDGLPVEMYWYFPTSKGKKNIRTTRYYYK